MQKSLLTNFSLFCCLVLIVAACKKNTVSNNNSAAEHDARVYHQAIKFGDMATAISATHSLLARDTNNLGFYDTLGVLYFRSNNYPQAIQAAQHMLEKDTSNLKMIELTARAYQALGQDELAIPYFRHLVLQTKNPEYSYQIAVSSFYMQQFNEAEAAIKHVLSSPSTDSINVFITVRDRHQQVPLKAAAYNLLGSVQIQKNMRAQAKESYTKALEIFPDFILPKENLEKLSNLK